MNKFIKVENNDNMVRDNVSGAISFINNSKDSREIKKRQYSKNKEYEQMKQDVVELKNDMSEIKALLHKLIER